MKTRTKWILSFMPLGAAVITMPMIAASCSNPEAEKKITELQKQKADLEAKIATLESDKTSSQAELDKVKQDKAKVDSKLDAIVLATRKEYKDVYTKYDTKLKELAVELKKAKSEKDATKKEEAINAVKVKVQNELKPLMHKQNALFALLRKTEKEANSKIRTIRIYHSNDEHGRIEFDDGKYNLYSGMLRTGTYLSDKTYDLLLSAGDMIQGLPLSDTDKGATIAKMAKNIGYQAVAVGNHEFDYGLKHVLDLNKELNKDAETMPFLSANIYYKELTPEEQAQIKPEELEYDASKVGQRAFKPYIIKTLESGMKVAIFGLTTPDTAYTSHPRNSKLVKFTEPLEETKKLVAEIREQHPDINFIIAITHLGTGRSNAAWTSEYLAQNAKNELDLIIDGHSHTLVKIHNSEDPNIYVTQTEAYTKYLGDIEIEFDTTTGKIVGQRQTLRDIYQIEAATLLETVDPQSPNEVLLKKLKEIYSAENDKLAFNSPVSFDHISSVNIDGTPYWKGRVQATGLGALFANAGVWNFLQTKAWKTIAGSEAGTIDNTFGLMNGGGLRANLAAGDVKYGDIRAISPFGNRPVTVKVKGSDALAAIKYGISKARSGGFAQLSTNVSYETNITKKLNSKTEKEEYMWEAKEGSIKINGKAIDPNKYYYISTNDYLAAGGDGYTMLNYTDKPQEVTQMREGQSLITEAIAYVNYVQKQDAVLDKNKFELKLEEYAKPETIAHQVVVIPADAGNKEVPTAETK
ncbi:bifunctional metallophosphatase/5'-nucleotidase [Mycoplasmopsis verecunda]|uniref:2',3'-cyclic-nucleotide 2'-phosphodiesterase/5'-or 3'-nucleotidase, 5'-nucleotidase family n=1 Tax=Mycoplasmopsis verecunda TaxID=171291 RepID=A0A1T4L3J9_9BACT|nr:bifunctional UDP-sugar hydrolase/5'-nucleotidase [Mycoplasmopsis verecunda]WPB54442.1 5'-nucleotidase C-terminal domain-containing protein [Mycoplasmopsis verecunda]SJZ49312.1 2',3'-cyclic-nucleotide 2'-phosphodiesterase/5'-or 3'-nucleotidase, 5'-nucleotidase family [Mycoplasmopsis verecunda]